MRPSKANINSSVCSSEMARLPYISSGYSRVAANGKMEVGNKDERPVFK
jgi:hypothetical protein